MPVNIPVCKSCEEVPLIRANMSVGCGNTNCTGKRKWVDVETWAKNNHGGRVAWPKLWFAAMTALLFVILSVTALAQCGVERWPVKTLQDKSVSEIRFAPQQTTIHALREPEQPKDLRTINPYLRLEAEKQVYTVQALLIGFKREADGDYHLVLADPVDRKKTMIAEIPSPKCANKKYAAQFETAAKFIESIAHATPAFKTLDKPVAVTVTGVFFFDFIHGQDGVAPNGAELHPVLEIK